MLSRTAEHALRAILFLARHRDQGPVKVEEIAAALGAPRNYLSKTMHVLAKQGLVEGTRGPHGGFVLLVPPDKIPLSRIVETFDSPSKGAVCLLGGRPCTDDRPCTAHFRWKTVQEAALAPLRETTVADLLATGDLIPRR